MPPIPNQIDCAHDLNPHLDELLCNGTPLLRLTGKLTVQDKKTTKFPSISYQISLNPVSCFNAGHIFVDIFMIIHCTLMKFGVNIEAKHMTDL